MGQLKSATGRAFTLNISSMPTQGQKTFIKEALNLVDDVTRDMSNAKISMIIEAVKQIRKTAPDVSSRLERLRKLARVIEAGEKAHSCSNCHKPTEPVNALNSCSC